MIYIKFIPGFIVVFDCVCISHQINFRLHFSGTSLGYSLFLFDFVLTNLLFFGGLENFFILFSFFLPEFGLSLFFKFHLLLPLIQIGHNLSHLHGILPDFILELKTHLKLCYKKNIKNETGSKNQR